MVPLASAHGVVDIWRRRELAHQLRHGWVGQESRDGLHSSRLLFFQISSSSSRSSCSVSERMLAMAALAAAQMLLEAAHVRILCKIAYVPSPKPNLHLRKNLLSKLAISVTFSCHQVVRAATVRLSQSMEILCLS